MGFVDQTGLQRAFTKLKSYVDGVEVGGQNLLLDTREFVQTKASGNYLHMPTGQLTGAYYNGCAVRRVNSVASAADVFAEWTVENCAVGDVYTFSFWGKGNCDKIRTYFYGPRGYIPVHRLCSSDGHAKKTGWYDDGNADFVVPADTWKRYWVVYELGTNAGSISTSTTKYPLVRADSSTLGKYFEICGVKLERGNKATEYTEAIEDYLPMTTGEVDSVFSSVFG